MDKKEDKDEEMKDKVEESILFESAEDQFNHMILLSNDEFMSKRMIFQVVMKVYFSQLTEGCGEKDCSNKFCHSCEDIKKKSVTECAKLAAQLTKESFGKKNHFCKGLNYSMPLKSKKGATGVKLKTFELAIESCKNLNDYSYLTRLVKLFGLVDCLDCSFLTDDIIKGKVKITEDSGIDFEELEKVYRLLNKLKIEKASINIPQIFMSTISQLSVTLLKISKNFVSEFEMRKVLILFLAPFLMDSDQHITQNIIMSILHMSRDLRNTLSIWISKLPRKYMLQLIHTLQHFITMRSFSQQIIDEHISYATRVLSIVNSSNLLLPRKMRISIHYFYNEAVNKFCNLAEDFNRWMSKKVENRKSFSSFCFCDYPFILDPTSKSTILQYFARIEQNDEVNKVFIDAIMYRQRTISPYCVLKIQRQDLINSSLAAIVENRRSLKKPLKVKFIGEDGVDEGGVRKEFFQLIIKQLFNANYGMFKPVGDGRLFYFNLNSRDLSEFKLIGQIIGLAIYNKVILDIKFPLVVYKKLLGMEIYLEDLEDLDPELEKGLRQLLEFEGNVEDVFCRTYQIQYKGWDGTIKKHNLVKEGNFVNVTNENRIKFVKKYYKWILDDSVQKQFASFRTGFHDVVTASTLKMFKPEELELLVCGSRKIDFDALEKSALYGEGYNKYTPIIKELWKVLKSFSLEDKKKFLQFCTGSDRVPISGLAKMKFIIAKNGDDPKRLPSSHTCYNVLLLPEYKDVSLLKKNLLIAITYGCVGFGLQ